jgi:pilus assembly protein Flp/PilA
MVEYMRAYVEAIRNRDEGQALVEYALILVLISVVSIAVMAALGAKIGTIFTQITNAL